MKTTLNPFENAKRTAQGTGGGVSPAVIEEMQAEISVLGSQNETQTQDITDIKAQLEELAGAYSTTEHKTGRKWIDGKDIYEVTIDIGALPNATSKSYNVSALAIDNVISLYGVAKDVTAGIQMNIPHPSSTANLNIGISYDNGNIIIGTDYNRASFNGIITIQYTKTN